MRSFRDRCHATLPLQSDFPFIPRYRNEADQYALFMENRIALTPGGKRYADNANTLELPAYTTTDLALRWDVSRDTTLTARGYNVFDKAYFTSAYYSQTQWLYGPGRRVELTLNHRF